MNDSLHNAAVEDVKKINSMYPENENYRVTSEDKLGVYTILTVSFNDKSSEYINYCVSRKGNILKSFYYLDAVVAYLDQGIRWRSLFIEQFGVVIGSILIIVMGLGGLLIIGFRPDARIPDAVWISISSGIAFLLGAKGIGKSTSSKDN